MGIASLGLSEIMSDDRIQNATMRTTHHILPGESFTIEHQMPYPNEYVVGSYTFVGCIDPDIRNADATGQLAELDAEDARYEIEKAEIQAELDNCEWGSEPWKIWNDKYWAAYNEHFRKRSEIFEKHRN